jgi:hypothetical protein
MSKVVVTNGKSHFTKPRTCIGTSDRIVACGLLGYPSSAMFKVLFLPFCRALRIKKIIRVLSAAAAMCFALGHA